MLQKIRTSKTAKVLAWYVTLMIILEIVQPMSAYALTEGPSQPEFNSFTPIGTSDMVDLGSGDLNYNIPIMDVGGYPINLAYNSGVTMDQEATWVGLGWNLNVGQINRNVRGLPDDFYGDEVEYKNNMKDNITVGIRPFVNVQYVGGADTGNTGGGSPGQPTPTVSGGFDASYNNYTGLSVVPSFGASFSISKNTSVGINLSSSAEEGATVSVSPSYSISTATELSEQSSLGMEATISPSITYNSRQGFQNFSLNTSLSATYDGKFTKMEEGKPKVVQTTLTNGWKGSSSISFATTAYTPRKRNSYKNNNVQFSFAAGASVYGFNIEGSFAAYATVQKLADHRRLTKAYGYEFNDWATENDLLDFNREKEQGMISKNTTALSVTNQSYDVYSVQGQNGGGMFRPYRGQVGYVFNPLVVDESYSVSAGGEVQAATSFHYGLNLSDVHTDSHTGNWETIATDYFKEQRSGNSLNYEKTYYKAIGEPGVDAERQNIMDNILAGSKPITLKLNGDAKAINNYLKKEGTSTVLSMASTFTAPIKRINREKRNQAIQKITVKEAQTLGLAGKTFKITNPDYAKPHHTAGYIITDSNGARSIYGEASYNYTKKESTFAVNASDDDICPVDNLVTYTDSENSTDNFTGRDNFYNSVTTPGYAHTYLLSSVLSVDYEDVKDDGPTDDDMGSYTKFTYGPGESNGSTLYKWRIPFKNHKASFNEGLKTEKGSKGDDKATYVYGERENKYLTKIESKTHIAYFDLEKRKDGRGVDSEDGGNSGSGAKMYCIKTIRLYSKSQLEKAPNGEYLDPELTSASVFPIKTAHFEYDYSLCKNVDNNVDTVYDSGTCSDDPAHIEDTGKLTLKKLYFTYRNSKMGRYAPYSFEYSDVNPNYNIKDYDIWGNYLANPSGSDSNNGPTSPQEYPYVNQDDDSAQDEIARAWTLNVVGLPSGGKIGFDIESDDYSYVQDKKAMRMFKIEGVAFGNSPTSADVKQFLYNDEGDEASYVAIHYDPDPTLTEAENIKRYTAGLVGEKIYFNFLLQMKGDDYEYVCGYFEMNGEASVDNNIMFIPMKKINIEGKTGSASQHANPISVAGYFFGRENMNRYMYQDYDTSETNVMTIGQNIMGNLESLLTFYKGGNRILKEDKKACKSFKKQKSWIRLLEPTGFKKGGGARVKTIVLSDNWNQMLNVNDSEGRYGHSYGQSYEYLSEDGKSSSGVATYEPNISKENPLIMPFYDRPEKLTARQYRELPFGESFYPAATVTYSRVKVNTLNADLKAKTGYTVTEHYTTKDFPTISNYTNLNKSSIYDSNERQMVRNLLNSMLGLRVNTHSRLTMTQGFTIETNDMNGKVKRNEVHDSEGHYISWINYTYSTKPNGKELENRLPVVDRNGVVTNDKEISTSFDVINDFSQSYSYTKSKGLSANLDTMTFGPVIVVIGMILPESAAHEQNLKTAVTTKVINRSGILIKMEAFDLGATVTTKNLAWDADTGQVLLTSVNNEYNDEYYNFNYPAHWYYRAMGLATENLDISGVLEPVTGSGPAGVHNLPKTGFQLSTASVDEAEIFKLGDELLIPKGFSLDGLQTENDDDPPPTIPGYTHAWVVDIKDGKIYLMDKDGNFLDPCSKNTEPFAFRIIRSGNRNQHQAFMASVTTTKNPLDRNGDGMLTGITGASPVDFLDENTMNYQQNTSNLRVVNASAVRYRDFWPSPWQYGGKIPYYPKRTRPGIPEIVPNPDWDAATATDFATLEKIGKPEFPFSYKVNPYVFNIKGDWRAEKSYAYLTGRNYSYGGAGNPRDRGFFNHFAPFYYHQGTAWKDTKVSPSNGTRWTYASSISKFMAHGLEVENKDALDRYSSAQYGYGYTLPVAVGGNAQSNEIAFTGFEESYDMYNGHFDFADSNTSGTGVSAQLSEEKSHTGRKSMKVPAAHSIKVSRVMNELPLTPVGASYMCEEPSNSSGSPTCSNGTYQIIQNSGTYQAFVPLFFGSNGPHEFEPVYFCPQSNSAGFSFNGSGIIYSSTSLPPSSIYLIVKDGDDDCIRLQLSFDGDNLQGRCVTSCFCEL